MRQRPTFCAVSLRALATTYGEGIMDFSASVLGDDEELYPVLESEPYGLHERCVVKLNDHGNKGQVTMPRAVFMRLPELDAGIRGLHADDAATGETIQPLFSQVLAGLDTVTQLAATEGAVHYGHDDDTEEDVKPEEVPGYVCIECGAITEDEPESPLYECGNCGTQFNREYSADGCSHRCPDCAKFSARCAKYGCTDCGSAEMEETTCYKCPECGQIFADRDDSLACCGVGEG